MSVTPNPAGDILVFEEFKRTQFPVLICLFGFSGCGKTLSAIKIAQGLGGKTMFLDTETGRGRVYADEAKGMGYTEMTPPFTPERYIAAFRQIEEAGYQNLVLDSGSHEWDGLGGMLDIADANVDSKGKKRTGLGKWSVKSRHKTFMNTMMAGRMNIIICLRAKDKFVQKKDEKGFDQIVMEGFVPLQERNFKYDMMVQLPMPEDGEGRYLMDRNKGFKCPGALIKHFAEGTQITPEIGVKIGEWIRTGDAIDETLRQLKAEALSHAEFGTLHFREYWKALPKEQGDKLKPYMANFESAAKEADLELDDPEEQPNSIMGSDTRSLKVGLDTTNDLTSVGVKPTIKNLDFLASSLISGIMDCKSAEQIDAYMGIQKPDMLDLIKANRMDLVANINAYVEKHKEVCATKAA